MFAEGKVKLLFKQDQRDLTSENRVGSNWDRMCRGG